VFSRRLSVPPGYERRDITRKTLVARRDVVDTLADAIVERQELIEFAERVPGARPLQGRQTAYAIPIGQTGVRGVVRRNHHGGALRRWTGSMFLWPTRAPRELEISMTLRHMDIPTPAVLAIALYRDGITATADVVTEEVPNSLDFGALLLTTTPDSEDRIEGWNATRRLLNRLAAAGIRHHDLNVKNVLLRRTDEGLFGAYLLDVDRVEFDRSLRDAQAGNRARLRRSVEKWRDTRGARITAAEIETLRRTAPSTP
jgi:tRNA A-37 threonylcarbamoyl transferase component Bud32